MCMAIACVDDTKIILLGVTKHRNGMERNGIYRNKPEYAGMRRNDTGMKRNEQEWYPNIPERAEMTPGLGGMTLMQIKQNIPE